MQVGARDFRSRSIVIGSRQHGRVVGVIRHRVAEEPNLIERLELVGNSRPRVGMEPVQLLGFQPE
jgi:hypothetical protein